MTETTHERYKKALEAIADGAADPVAVANEALRSRKYVAEPNPEWDAKKSRAEGARKARTLLAGKLYNEWLIAGRPPIAAFARKHGRHASNMERLLRHAEDGWPWGKRRLGLTRSRDYRTANEIYAEQDRDGL